MTDHIPTEAIEAAAKAMDENFNPDRYPIMAAMFTDYATVALEAALPFLRPEPSEDDREALERLLWSEIELAYSPVTDANRRIIIDALLAAGFTRRPMPSREQVKEWARERFGVSNGTQAWVEFQGSAEGLADAVLALFKGADR